MQHSLFLWWVIVVVVAMAGASMGVFCTMAARQYERLLWAGFFPDGHSLVHALRAAYFEPLLPIIWVDDAGRADVAMVLAPLLAGVVLAGLYARHGHVPVLFCTMAAVLVLLLMMACIDARVCLLPDALTQPLLWLGLGCAWSGLGLDLHHALGGVIAGYVLLAAPRCVWSRWRQVDAIGAGDVKLLAALGAWVGAAAIMPVLMLACVMGAVFAALQQRSWRPAGAYPFGPFIALAAVADFLLPSGLQSLFYV